MFTHALRNAVRRDARSIPRRFSTATALFNAVKSAKVFESADDGIHDLRAGQTLLVGGFGLCGTPETLFQAVTKRDDLRNFVVVSNNMGTPGHGLGTCRVAR